MTPNPHVALLVPGTNARSLLRAFRDSAVDRERIAAEVRRVLVAEGQDPGLSRGIAERVEFAINRRTSAYIHAAEIREITARVLMQTAVQEQATAPFWFKVASRFVLQADATGTSADTAEANRRQNEHVTLRGKDGSTAFFDWETFNARVRFAAAGLDISMPAADIAGELSTALRDGMTAIDARASLILAAAELKLLDTPFTHFAGRFLLSFLYEEVLGWDLAEDGPGVLGDLHRRYFKAHVGRLVDEGLLDAALLDADLDELAAGLDASADYDLDFVAAQSLRERFLLSVKTDGPARCLETPQFFFMRVALGCSLAEAPDAVVPRTLVSYRLLKARRFCPSPVVLMNAGRPRAQLAQNYVYVVPDSTEGIFHRGIVDNSLAARSGATVSGNWSNVRGTGAFLAGTNGESQGVIPFLKLHNTQLQSLTSAERQHADGMVTIEAWHNDVLEFLELRLNQGDERRRTADLATGVLMSDLLMRRIEARARWTLFRSSDVVDLVSLHGADFDRRFEEYEALVAGGKMFGHSMPALELWKKILNVAFSTGYPRLIFKDSCARRSAVPWHGTVPQCGARGGVCLPAGPGLSGCSFDATVNLVAHCDADGTLMRDLLRETVRAVMRALDNLATQSVFPTEWSRRGSEKLRAVGLSAAGLDDQLARLRLPWGGEAAAAVSEDACELLSFLAIEASAELAHDRGPAPGFAETLWQRNVFPVDSALPPEAADSEAGQVTPPTPKCDWPGLRERVGSVGLRNLHLFGIDGGGVEATLLGCTAGLQPRLKHLEMHQTALGEFGIVNAGLVTELKRLGEWDDGLRRVLLGNAGSLEPGPGCPTELAARLRLLPQELKSEFVLGPQVDPFWALACAARRGRWMDGAEAFGIWIAQPDMAVLSRLLRTAWRLGLKMSPRLHFGGGQPQSAR